MATAPRDRTLIVVKRTRGRINRKHNEHVVRWDAGLFNAIYWKFIERMDLRPPSGRALTMALSMWRRMGAVVTFVPSGARTSLRPPHLRIEIGTRTVTDRPSLVGLGSVITPPCGILL